MPMDSQSRRLIDRFLTDRQAREHRAIHVHAETKRLQRVHPDWPLNMCKTVAEVNLDRAVKNNKQN